MENVKIDKLIKYKDKNKFKCNHKIASRMFSK